MLLWYLKTYPDFPRFFVRDLRFANNEYAMMKKRNVVKYKSIRAEVRLIAGFDRSVFPMLFSIYQSRP